MAEGDGIRRGETTEKKRSQCIHTHLNIVDVSTREGFIMGRAFWRGVVRA